MEIPFPFNTVIVITANMVLLGALTTLIFYRSLSRLRVSPALKRKWLALVILFLAGWLGTRLFLGQNRVIAPGQLIPVAFTVIFSAAGLAAAFSPVFRRAVLSIPQAELIGIQFFRILGFVFLALYDMRLLPAAFALPAGYGDVLVGLTAPLVVYALAQNKPSARALAWAWNGLGLLDFTVALFTGFGVLGPYARQLAHQGQSIAYLDYVLLIPGFAVPVLTLLHINSLVKLRKGV